MNLSDLEDVGIFDTVESHYNRPASNGYTPITEAILKAIKKVFFTFYIGDNGNPHMTHKNGWSLEI